MSAKLLVIAARGGRFGPGKVHYPANYDNVSARSGMTLCGRHVYGDTLPEGERPVDYPRHRRGSGGRRSEPAPPVASPSGRPHLQSAAPRRVLGGGLLRFLGS